MVDKSIFDQIINLIDLNNFSDAESKVLSIIQNKENIPDRDYSYACFLRGYIHTDCRYKDKKEYVAKKMLLENIESSCSHPIAYCLYANLLDDKNTAVNYLKTGLHKFPDQADIYMALLQNCHQGEIDSYINEIKEKGIKDASLLCRVAEKLLSKNNWEKTEYFLNKLVEITPSENREKLYYNMLYTFSLTFQQKELRYCKNSFQEIINEDISNSLNYAPYMGYAWCCVIAQDFKDAISYVQKIPIANVLRDFDDGPWWNIIVDMSRVYQRIFSDILSNTNDNETILKLKALETLYMYSPSEMFNINRFSKRHLTALKKYHKKHSDNIEVACAIYNAPIG